jgi:hypothetical protein
LAGHIIDKPWELNSDMLFTICNNLYLRYD